MNAAARQFVTTALANAAMLDTTLTAERQAAALDALDGKSLAGIVNAAPMPRILSTEQMAELLNCSKTWVRALARTGELRRVYMTGTKRAIGYSEQSGREYLEKITGDKPTA